MGADVAGVDVNHQVAGAPQVAIAATFTAEPIAESLQFWLDQLWPEMRIAFAPFNQVFQQLLQQGMLQNNRSGYNVVLIRPEDWAGDGGDGESSSLASRLARSSTDFLSALDGGVTGSTIVVHCPPSDDLAKDVDVLAWLQDFDAQLAERARTLPGLHVVTWAELARLYPVERGYDRLTDQSAAVPYTGEGFAALGTMVARRIHALRVPAYKVIVLDCDDTLWHGVLGEDGFDGIRVTPGRRRLQAFLQGQRRAGVLLCIASKNVEADVMDVLTRHPDMLLRPDDFVARRIDWRPKSVNTVELASEVGVAVDSCMFLDDSGVECAEVEARCPGVLAFPVPTNDDEIETFLNSVWPFDRIGTTDEDRERHQQYMQEAHRRAIRATALTWDEFLKTLELSVAIGPARSTDYPRIVQLAARSTQFNASGHRLSESDLGAAVDGSGWLTVRARDRFGDYGLIGVAQYERRTSSLRVPTLLLSCRALGRGIEHRLLQHLGGLARWAGLEHVEIVFSRTARNVPIVEFFAAVGARLDADESAYLLRVDQALACEVRYDAAPAGPALTSSVRPSSASGQVDPERKRKVLRRAAFELFRAVDVYRALPRLHGAGTRIAHDRRLTPDDDEEAKVCRIVEHELDVPQVGPASSLRGSGMSSLALVGVAARLSEAFGVEIPLDDLIGLDTPAELAAVVARMRRNVARSALVGAAAQMDAVPLTVSQLPYLFDAELNPRSRSNYVRVDVTLAGPLNRPALENALRAIVDHQECLRVRFGYDERGPVQTAGPTGATVPITCLEAAGKQSWSQALERLDLAEADAWLDLKIGPILRFFLVKLSSTRHVLRWLVHHAVADGWSENIFLRDLARTYEAIARGLPSPLSALPVRYADWAVWDSRRRQEPSVSESYWRQRFAADRSAESRPENAKRAPGGSVQRWNVATDIGLVDATALMDAAAQLEVTFFELLFAALAMTLTRAWGSSGFTIGVLNANRPRADLRDIIGQFADIVPVTVEGLGECSRSAAVGAVRRALAEARRHSEVPFFRIVQLAGRREPFGSSGLCDVLFNMTDFSPRSFEIDDLTISRIGDDIGDVDPRLALYVAALRSEGGLRLTISGSDAAFAPAGVGQLLSNYVALCRSLVRPDRRGDHVEDQIDNTSPQPRSVSWEGG